MLQAFAAAGVPTFDDQNGVMMEGQGGAAFTNVCVRDGRRQSVFRSYVYPYMDRPNLTVLTGALVTRLTLDGMSVTGVEFLRQGTLYRVGAAREVVLSLGALHTPKLLMQSGIGDEAELKRVGIPVIQHLPGVGRNFQDHFMASCVLEAREPIEPRSPLASSMPTSFAAVCALPALLPLRAVDHALRVKARRFVEPTVVKCRW
jgi:choline dehydrogenase